jgi:Domain of unknown function (DUF1874)
MKKLFFFNTTIAALAGNSGIIRLTPITRTEAIRRIQHFLAEIAETVGGMDNTEAIQAAEGQLVSAIGHDASADAMTALLNRKIEVNRIPASMQHGDIAIALKLRGRIAEGQILDLPAMESIGYDLVLIEAFSSEFIITPFVGSTDCY